MAFAPFGMQYSTTTPDWLPPPPPASAKKSTQGGHVQSTKPTVDLTSTPLGSVFIGTDGVSQWKVIRNAKSVHGKQLRQLKPTGQGVGLEASGADGVKKRSNVTKQWGQSKPLQKSAQANNSSRAGTAEYLDWKFSSFTPELEWMA
jgi:hypothetical protein